MNTYLTTYDQRSQDYARIEQAIRYLEENFRSQPSLGEIAAHLGLSEYHFQRLFTRWVGISPKRFLQFLTKEYVGGLLQESHNILEAAIESGLSSPGRLHDLLVTCEAVTPGEYKTQGESLLIEYGFHPTPFGECLLASTPRGICSLMFVELGEATAALADLKGRWQRAAFAQNQAGTQKLAAKAFAGIQQEPLPIFLRGTNFQIKVWEALLRIPSGTVVTYQDIALSIGLPRTSRAVGNAVAHNPMAVVVPCHRVIRKDGWFGNYLYGTPRKMALFGWERAQKELVG
jgi:AraC family transcriptional regulator, regulatory protein of adaptative response / methylated-DNA-[protein]-cysteine methyltransferase